MRVRGASTAHSNGWPGSVHPWAGCPGPTPGTASATGTRRSVTIPRFGDATFAWLQVAPASRGTTGSRIYQVISRVDDVLVETFVDGRGPTRLALAVDLQRIMVERLDAQLRH